MDHRILINGLHHKPIYLIWLTICNWFEIEWGIFRKARGWKEASGRGEIMALITIIILGLCVWERERWLTSYKVLMNPDALLSWVVSSMRIPLLVLPDDGRLYGSTGLTLPSHPLGWHWDSGGRHLTIQLLASVHVVLMYGCWWLPAVVVVVVVVVVVNGDDVSLAVSVKP